MKNKKAAMEMSVGTIVTIVLLMSVLVLGIVLVQKIFRSSTSAIDQIDGQIQNEINKLFTDEGKKLVIYPTSKEIVLERGDSPKGFAFSVMNKNSAGGNTEFSYVVEADDVSKCNGEISETEATEFLLPKEGDLSIPVGDIQSELIKFVIPETATPCTILYRMRIKGGGSGDYASSTVFVTIE